MQRFLIAAALSGTALTAQYALSAMAGYIHYTEGEAWLGDRKIAPKPDDFEHVLEGRLLRTGEGRAELLLVPGSFVRIGQHSEIEMISSGLTSAILRLHAGSLVVDLQTQFEKDAVGIQVADSDVRFRKTGPYRIDMEPSGPISLRVLDGRARVEPEGGESFDVKSGQLAKLDSGSTEKLAKAPDDPLDAWNSERHEELAVLAERAHKERWDGMSDAERNILRMILDRPTRPPVSNRPQPPQSSGSRRPN